MKFSRKQNNCTQYIFQCEIAVDTVIICEIAVVL